jgi:polyvinyl alcohol dehydrogenase (cytochrome)
MSVKQHKTALAAWVIFAPLCSLKGWTAALDGPAVYSQRCAVCHDNAADRTPPRARIAAMTPEQILAAMTNGAMQTQAAGLAPEEMRNVAEFLSGRRIGQVAAAPKPNPCAKSALAMSLKVDGWNGWGVDLENTRYQSKPGLQANDVPRLKVKWAYALHGQQATGSPTVIGERLFLTHATGRVDALDAKTGCEYWNFAADSAVRTPVKIGELKGAKARYAAFFGSFKAFAYAVDAETGKEIWRTQVDDHAVARLTGAPTYYDGVVYFPVSSHEEVSAASEKYPCCTFRGAVVALDAATGKQIWKAYGSPVAPKPTKLSTAGVQLFGPAGGAIWSSPTIDVKRKVIYAATGNSYTDIDSQGGNDSIVAFDMKTGKRVWANQITPKDSFILGCPKGKEGTGNCPKESGPDFDFGSSPILRTLANGKQILIVGQKSGMVYGIDPDKKGALVWETRVGVGSPLGGVEWGFSADTQNVYVPVSDAGMLNGGTPGLYALELATGKVLWKIPTPAPVCSWSSGRCTRAQAAASSVFPGIVLAGAFDGHLRAHAVGDGAIVWDYDTAPAIDTVNGMRVEGGSIDATGPVVVDGMVYINSGYGSWGKSGRLLLAFSVDGK